jgi:boron transporter
MATDVCDIVVINPHGIPYFPFLCWIGIWSMIMHFAIAILNGVVFLKYVTRFSCDVFGFFVCCIYVQKGVQVPLRNSSSPTPRPLRSIGFNFG